MRRVQPAVAFVLLLSIQSLCVVPGLGQRTPPTVTAAPVLPATEEPVRETTPSPRPVTEVPQAESVGTINLVISQVHSGPPESLQPLDGVQDFHNGDGVRVTQGGKGQLDLSDGTQMILFNETEVTGVNVSTAPPETDLFLQNQGFLGYVPPGGHTTVHMPNGAAITILGTTFFILYNAETQTATAGNFDGTVTYIAPGGAEQELSPGQMVEIPVQGSVVLLDLPFTPEQFELTVDGAGTPSAGLTALLREYQIEPKVFDGIEVARMTHEPDPVAAAFSPDGQYVISGGCDDTSSGCAQGSARVWEALTGRELVRMIHENDIVRAVAFSPDGELVATGGGFEDETARVWETFSGQEVARIIHDSQVNKLAFSPDGQYVISGDSGWEAYTARVWDAFNGVEVARMTHTASVYSVAFSPDGKLVVSGGDSTARVWEAFTGKEIARMTHAGTFPGYVRSVAFSPDGQYVVSGSCDDVSELCYGGTARVWEALTGTEVSRVNDPGSVESVAFSPDGRLVVLASGQATTEGTMTGTVVVWEAFTGKEVARMTQESFLTSVAFSPDGNYVASGGSHGSVRVLDAFSGREVARMSHDDRVDSVAFSPDGRYLLTASLDGTARVWSWYPLEA